ncbi:MAG TPA: hypothetical protein VFY71_18510 [Planctomycetota bacterium]|nr:hypothetical protein [Planctomycetota bacterium]
MKAALLAVALLLLPASGAAQTAQTAQTAHDLGPDEAAWVDKNLIITLADLDRYLATVYARKQEGQAALLQVLQEAIVRHEAGAAGITASDAEVNEAIKELDASARASGGGSLADALTADVGGAELRDAVRLHVLEERLVRAADQLAPDAPVSAERLQSWLDTHVQEAALQEAPLDDARAATWSGGELAKVDVGTRLRAVLPKDSLTGILTEMIGVQLVRRRAAELDIDLTPAEVTREVLLRDAALKEHASGQQVSYTQYVQQLEHRSLAEHIQSDAFTTEVLVRLISERLYTEDKARAFWEQHRDAYGERGPDWESARLAVWKDIRQIIYKQLFTNSSIVRRY